MIYRTFVLLLVVAAAALGVVAVGCGDDSSSGSSDDGTIETSSMTKVEFVKRANTLCEQATEKFAKAISDYLGKQSSSSKSEGEVGADGLRTAVLPKVEVLNEEIRDLGAPAGDEAQIEAFLVAQQNAIDSLEKRKSVNLNTGVNPAFSEAGRLARQYGIALCAFN